MRTCHACGASDWHPDVRNCMRIDCELIAARVEQRAQPRQPAVHHRQVRGMRFHRGVISSATPASSSGNGTGFSPALEVAHGQP